MSTHVPLGALPHVYFFGYFCNLSLADTVRLVRSAERQIIGVGCVGWGLLFHVGDDLMVGWGDVSDVRWVLYYVLGVMVGVYGGVVTAWEYSEWC